MTADDFVNWKASPVTKKVFQAIHELIYMGQIELGTSAGIDSLNDRFKVGYIAGLEAILNMSLEDVSEEGEKEDD